MSCDGLENFVRAVHFAAIKHNGQLRKDGTTAYINHPIGVAHHLVECGLSDPVLLCSAVLHDTVEDTETTFDEIKHNFGEEVHSIVKEVTDDKSLPKQRRKQLQIEHAAQSSSKAKLLKLADKLYNLEDLEKSRPIGWTEERVNEYFDWAQKVISALKTGDCPELEQKVDIVLRRHLTTK